MADLAKIVDDLRSSPSSRRPSCRSCSKRSGAFPPPLRWPWPRRRWRAAAAAGRGEDRIRRRPHRRSAPRRSTSSRKSARSPGLASRKPRIWSRPRRRPSRKASPRPRPTRSRPSSKGRRQGRAEVGQLRRSRRTIAGGRRRPASASGRQPGVRCRRWTAEVRRPEPAVTAIANSERGGRGRPRKRHWNAASPTLS